MVPYNPVWSYGNEKIRQVIEETGRSVTGVQVDVKSFRFGLFMVQTDIAGFQLSNPKGYSDTPFFMKCETIHSDVSWLRMILSVFNLIPINEVRVGGLHVYVEQKFALTSNAAEVLAYVANHPLGKWAEDELLTNKRRKYMIDHIRIDDMQVHVSVQGTPMADISVPPMVVSGIGVQQHGVPLEELIGLLINALSVSAMSAENEQVKGEIFDTMKQLKKETGDKTEVSRKLMLV